MSCSPAPSLEPLTARPTATIERKCAQVPSSSHDAVPSSSTTTTQTTGSSLLHDELVTRLRSALKALGGRPNATPTTSSNRFVADELEACSRRVVTIPRMQSLDSADVETCSDRDIQSDLGLHSVDTFDVEIKRTKLQRECEELEVKAGALREEVDKLETARAALDAVEDTLCRQRVELNEIEGRVENQESLLRDLTEEIDVKQRRAQELDRVLATQQGSLDARSSHLDSLETLANEGERLVEDQSRRASAALEELEWMDEELGRVSAELVEVTARLDEKTAMLREATALEKRLKQSKQRLREIEAQERLLEELERRNAAALSESKRLAREIDGLRRGKQAISFDLEPALHDALEELERSKSSAVLALMEEQGKVGRLEREIRELRQMEAKENVRPVAMADFESKENDLVLRLENERIASTRRTRTLSDGNHHWRTWRPSLRIRASL